MHRFQKIIMTFGPLLLKTKMVVGSNSIFKFNMNINIVFKYTNDWYVGEIYNYIANKFIEKYLNISFKIID